MRACPVKRCSFVAKALQGVLCWLCIGYAVSTSWGQTPEGVVTEVITLDQAYDRAVATDQSIGIAWQEIQKANLLPWSALTKITPRLTGNASYSNTQGGGGGSSSNASQNRNE